MPQVWLETWDNKRMNYKTDWLPRLKEIQEAKASRRLLAVLIFIAVVAYYAIVELVIGPQPLF